MSIKVKVNSSKSIRAVPKQDTTTSIVAPGERKPVIVPDSVVLGIDTIGAYVQAVDAGQGIIVTPESDTELANLVISHANTSVEISTNNDVLEFTRNVDIDQFGHVTNFYNTSLSPLNFTANSTNIQAKDITLGNTSLTIGESTTEITGLTRVDVGELTLTQDGILGVDDIRLVPGEVDDVINVTDHRISNLKNPIFPQDAVTVNYLEQELGQVGDPVDPEDVANKRYVDNAQLDMLARNVVLAATTVDLGGTYTSGNSSFSDTINLSPAAVIDIDGVTDWELGDGLLVKDQTDPKQNGRYELIQVGALADDWIFQRDRYTDETSEYGLTLSEIPGSFVFVTDGTLNGQTGWVATVGDAETFALNTDDIIYKQFQGKGLDGRGLTLTDNTRFDIDYTQTFEQINGKDDSLIISSNVVDVNSSGGFIIPVGTTLERPTPDQGMIRYNTSDSRFEAYNGIAWTGLGGVVDVDQDTKIIAENSPGSDNDQLKFYTANTVVMQLQSDGDLYFGSNLNKLVIDYNSGDATFKGLVNFDSTGAIVIPDGTTAERPTAERGMIRFNISDQQFEGYDGTAWKGLGGVIDVDQDTKIIAENTPGSDNDQLKFFTANTERLRLDTDGDFKFGDGLDKFTIDWATGAVDINSSLEVDTLNLTGLTQNRVVFVGANGQLVDDNRLRFSANTFTVEGNADIHGNLTLGGNIRIGDANVDTINVVADFTSDLIPDATLTYSLGSINKNWNRVFTPTLKSDSGVITIDETGALNIPVGSTSDRPTPTTGMLRYNTTDARFEGYDGNIWAGLAGSVIDVDQDTKIIAETSPNADNDELQFFTAGVQRFYVSNNGVIATAANTDLTFDPSGNINVSNNIITGVGDPVNPSDAVNLRFINDNFSSNLDITDGANTGVIDLLDSPRIYIGTGLELGANTDLANNEFEIGLEDTGVTADLYGTDGFTPRIRVDAQGRITFATEIPVELQANAIPDFTETVHDLVGEMMRNNTELGINVVGDDANDKIDFRTNDFVINLTGDILGSNTVVHNSNVEIATSLDYTNLYTTLDQRYLEVAGDTATGDIAAPRFLDADANTFYGDFDGTSRINRLELGYDQSFGLLSMQAGSNTWNYLYSQGVNIGFLDAASTLGAYFDISQGNFHVAGNLRANVFQDRNNIVYNLNPSGSGSRLYEIDVDNFVEVGNYIEVGNDLRITSNQIYTPSVLNIDTNGSEVNVNNSQITNLVDPTNAQDAATKYYVDTEITSLTLGGISISAPTGNTDVIQLGETLFFQEGEGIDITASNNQILIAGELANNTNIGIASFNINNFTVTGGDVTVTTLDGGTF